MQTRPPIEIHIAQPTDAPEIARLNALFNGRDEPAGNYAARLADPHRVDNPLLAEVDGRVIGLANLRLVPAIFYPEPYAELTELFVEEPFRRQGVGRALILHAERLARDSGASEMLVRTDFYNHGAQELYRALGYVHHDIALIKSLDC